mmetsp:Transcript_24983/g.34753  ORF Transcript_24983/g.34753 Transcript_24983/m.34753 type:complete len:743 (+) Transcript_24983:119-2347(+)|eukprot:CAMPEP_0184491876 /NCGR_PEP_ID=MMETSP0113_2-20130426/21597_1 /TAXON_ID=91329 /ORGANISM="Norrisiella sphaerica, Strain BC52" /LENGTH=742 /DNA_ID=CAMNT_0026876421 /DNA_START=109 /DNA_END=2337 /DNA_ORIENTATION=+
MAFEVFDDAAFYYFLLTVIVMILTPWTMSKLCDAFGICSDDDELEVRKIDDVGGYHRTDKLEESIDEDDKPNLFRCSNVIFFLLWAFLLIIIIRLPGSEDSLQTFHPFQILEIDVGATDREIKKAYRKLSLKYHPDKNPNDEVAAKNFILVSKAYQTLTDPQTKKNWEEYGNPDGYQGTSVTIGLPSFLTDKNNEFQVLSVYFILVIIIPPILVFMWWKNAKEMGPEGVMHRTVQFYYWFIDKNWSVNFLNKFTALYAASAEFQELLDTVCLPKHQDEWEKLRKAVEVTKGKKVEFKGKANNALSHPRIQCGSLLLMAHLLRIEVEPVFEKTLKAMLKRIDDLIPAMLGTTWRYPGKTPFATPCFSVVQFNQMLVQAMWAHDSVFKQLPHDCADDIRKNGRKIYDWDKFKNLSDEKKKKKVFKDFTEEQIQDIERAAEQIPQVGLKWNYRVEDEKQVYTDDLVTVDVSLFRKGAIEDKERENGGGVETKKAETDKEVKQDKLSAAEDEDEEDESDKEEEAISTLDFVAEEQKKEKKKKRTKRQALAPFFPFTKYESWYLVLVTQKTTHNKLVMDVQKVDLDDIAESNLRFRAPDKKGKYKYELHALCDSYVGCDIFCEFEISVKEDRTRKTEDDYLREKEERDREEEEEEKRREEEYPPRWYYCYYPSFWEMVLNAFVLALLCVFIFNFLHSRGYWQDYVQPVVDFTYNTTCTYIYDLDPIFYPPEKIEDEFDIPGMSEGES